MPPDEHLMRWATAAGAVVGVTLTVAAAVAGPLRSPAPVDRAGAAEAFLAAWSRSRQVTVVVRSRVERRRPDGTTLASAGELVQRPPDRLVRRFGGVSGVRDGRTVTCTADTGEPRCTTTGGPAVPYDESVRRELETFRDWFRPPAPATRPRYRVVHDVEEGCFDLILAVAGAEAPYGTDARLCFDAASGALSSIERRYENGVVESERAETIVRRVTPADLALPTGDPPAR